MVKQPEPIAYSVEHAARAAGVSRSFLYLIMDRGELSFAKLGKRRLIRAEDLNAYIAANLQSKRAA